MSSKDFEDLREKEQLPSLKKFIQDNQLEYTDGNRRENYLRSFWDSTKFIPGSHGKDLIDLIKNQINNPNQAKNWDEYEKDYAVDIDELAKSSYFQTQQLLYLKEGYGNALFRIAKESLESSLKKRRDDLEKRVKEAEEKLKQAEELKIQTLSTSASPRRRGTIAIRKRENIPEFPGSSTSSPATTPTTPRKRAASVFAKKKQEVEINPELKTLEANRVALAAAELKLKELDQRLEEIRVIVVGGKMPQPMAKVSFPNRRRSETNQGSKLSQSPRRRGQTEMSQERSLEEAHFSYGQKNKSVEPVSRVDSYKKSSEEELNSKSLKKAISPVPSPRVETRTAQNSSEERASAKVDHSDEDSRSIKILTALSSGDEEMLDKVREQFYAKSIAVEKTFNMFLNQKPNFLSESILISQETPEISDALVSLFEHVISLREENLRREKFGGFYFFRTRPDEKIRDLEALLRYFLKPNTTLRDVKIRLDGILYSNAGMGVMENRGPFGVFKILSAIKGEKNTNNNSYVNSTTESKLLQLQKVVQNKYDVDYAPGYMF